MRCGSWRRYGCRVGKGPRQRLATLLGATSGRGAFSARRTAAPGDLHIDVAGVGPLEIPVPAAQARQLCGIARPARYGLGEQTLTDSRVRSTWEVPKSRVRIDQRRWNRTLSPILAKLRADLGLSDGCTLKAELHSVLVYAPRQFFVPHQDSEKSDAMVGTLTVTLPGTSRGGALVVEHADARATYRSSGTLLSFVAFYADCRHEVRPVTSGYRVVLTYNLLLAGDAASGLASAPDDVAELATCLDEHFREQNRLVYLLDHQYTARGLSWSRLKGVDAARVSALSAAAQVSACEIVLALADVHETWSCDEPYERGSYWHDDEDDDNVEDDARELGELLDWSISLDTWVDRSGAPAQPAAFAVGDAEVCATTPTAKLTPYESEYEGYMGNYGNTMDRWYRRGAVVIWPRRLDFAVRAEASPSWALDSLAGLLRGGELARARELVDLLAPFWADALRVGASVGVSAYLPPRQPNLGRALLVAHGLDDPRLATMLLRPFRPELLTPADAPVLAAVAERYGEGWMSELLAEWDLGGSRGWYRAPQERLSWIAALPELCLALNGAGGSGVARLLLAACWIWLAESVARARSIIQPSGRAQTLDELSAPIAGLLVGAAASDASELSDTAFAFLCAGDDALLPCLVKVLRVVSDAAPEHRVGAGFEALARHIHQRLDARLAQPPRDPDDWSINASGGCACQLCATLDAFLADPDDRILDWPLAQQGRRHVHDRIDRQELPVEHRTRRVGRPYTLVLTKAPTLFEREAQERHSDETDLQMLRELL